MLTGIYFLRVSFDPGFRIDEQLGLFSKFARLTVEMRLWHQTLARLMIVVRPLESVHEKNHLTRILMTIVDPASINLEAESASFIDQSEDTIP
jgi:hypothetical protein